MIQLLISVKSSVKKTISPDTTKKNKNLSGQKGVSADTTFFFFIITIVISRDTTFLLGQDSLRGPCLKVLCDFKYIFKK
jgi:hypothetical protein